MLTELADVSRIAARSPASPNASRVSRWQSSKLPATAYARTFAALAVEHRQLRFLRRADAAVGIQDDHAGVRHAVKGVRHGAAGVAGGRGQDGQRLVAGWSDAISRAITRAPTSLNASVGP